MSDVLAIGDVLRLATRQVFPSTSPRQLFEHYSLPAFDEVGGPVLELGGAIDSGKFALDSEALLVSKLNPRISRVQHFRGVKGLACVASTEFMVFEPIDSARVDLGFFRHLFSSSSFVGRLRAWATGTTNSHVRVRPSDVLQWQVEVPPIREQRRIAGVLDTLDATITASDLLASKLRNVGKAALESDLAATRMWPQDELGPRLQRIDAGKSPDVPDLRPGPGRWGVLKVSAVHPDGFRPFEAKELTRAEHVRPQDRVKAGDVLLTRANTTELVGLCCIVREDPGLVQLSDKTLRLVPNSRLVDPQFLALLLQGSRGRSQIEALGTGTSGSMKNISQSEICGLRFSWPDLDEQRAIVRRALAHERRLAVERALARKLKELRSGIADDMLTRRIRTVPV